MLDLKLIKISDYIVKRKPIAKFPSPPPPGPEHVAAVERGAQAGAPLAHVDRRRAPHAGLRAAAAAAAQAVAAARRAQVCTLQPSKRH